MHRDVHIGIAFAPVRCEKTFMKKEEIYLWDVKRILFGQAPPEFLLEVFIRSLIVYVAALIVMRWMGKRMNGQLTIIELSVMVMMGAIISVPMQIPDRGILQGLLVLRATLFFLRFTNRLSFRSTRFEDLVQGSVVTLVKDGVLQLDELKQNKLTNEQVFMALRKENVFNLGKVKRLYLKACGLFSVYHQEEPGPGLAIYPPEDEKMFAEGEEACGEKACATCGLVQKKETALCTRCGKAEWSKAVL